MLQEQAAPGGVSCAVWKELERARGRLTRGEGCSVCRELRGGRAHGARGSSLCSGGAERPSQPRNIKIESSAAIKTHFSASPCTGAMLFHRDAEQQVSSSIPSAQRASSCGQGGGVAFGGTALNAREPAQKMISGAGLRCRARGAGSCGCTESPAAPPAPW